MSFGIEEGCVTALVGPNGAGKTTLLRCLAALEHPFSGSVHICGIDTAGDPRGIHRKVAYLADFFGLYRELTVRQSLLHMAALHEIPKADISRVVDETAEELDLKELIGSNAGVLSRGQRQRLAIAMAIIHKPPVLLLDEPASGLDPEARYSLSRLIQNLKAKGMTIVVSSHILSELEDYSDAMLTLDNGRILGHQKIGSAGHAVTEKVIEVTLASETGDISAVLASAPAVTGVHVQGRTAVFNFSGDPGAQAALLKEIIERGFPVASFKERVEKLQDVYMSQLRAKPGGRE